MDAGTNGAEWAASHGAAAGGGLLRQPSAQAPAALVVKQPLEVELVMSDGTRLAGSLYVRRGERLQDMLNSAGDFLPLREAGGDLLMVHKRWIAACRMTGSE